MLRDVNYVPMCLFYCKRQKSGRSESEILMACASTTGRISPCIGRNYHRQAVDCVNVKVWDLDVDSASYWSGVGREPDVARCDS